MVIDIAETISGECCKVYSVGRDQYVASLFLCVDDVAASKVIYEMMEFAFDEDPEFADSILKRVEEVGARPVIAHAERYEFIQDYPQIAYRWFRKGYVIQANKGSFLGRFGGGPKRAADSLLRHNLISVIASDAHSPLQRTPYMMDVYEELSREYSENHLDVLFQYNPARICDNREILRLEPVPYSGRQQLY